MNEKLKEVQPKPFNKVLSNKIKRGLRNKVSDIDDAIEVALNKTNN
jgi:hypothetical protein